MVLPEAYPDGAPPLYGDVKPLLEEHVEASEALINPEDIQNPVVEVIRGVVDPDIIPGGGHMTVELRSETNCAEVLIVDEDKPGPITVDSYILGPVHAIATSGVDRVLSDPEEAQLRLILANTDWEAGAADYADSNQGTGL